MQTTYTGLPDWYDLTAPIGTQVDPAQVLALLSGQTLKTDWYKSRAVDVVTLPPALDPALVLALKADSILLKHY